MNSAITLAQLRRKPHWSYSSINGLLNICSLQWAFHYVYGELPLFTPANMVFGKTFHRVADYVTGLHMDGKQVSHADVQTLFADLLSQECRISEPAVRFDEGESLNTLLPLGRGMVQAWLQSLDPEEKILHVGMPFTVPLEDAGGEKLDRPLIGEFDCVVEQDGCPVIVDWKTAARKWPESRVRTDLQPTCYLYAHSKLGDKGDTRFRFDVVTKTKVPAVEHYATVRHDDDFQRMIECVKVAEGMIRQEHFLPADQSFACAGCPYSLACAGWQRNRNRSLYHLELAA